MHRVGLPVAKMPRMEQMYPAPTHPPIPGVVGPQLLSVLDD